VTEEVTEEVVIEEVKEVTEEVVIGEVRGVGIEVVLGGVEDPVLLGKDAVVIAAAMNDCCNISLMLLDE